MEILFDDEYLNVSIDKQKSLLYFEWKEKTESIPDDVFLHHCQKITDLTLSSKSKLMLENALNFKSVVPPDVQEILAKQMIVLFNDKVDRIAHVYAIELIANLSQQQVWDGDIEKKFEENFFDTVEDAKEWILNR